MSRPAYAKCPSMWTRVLKATDDPDLKEDDASDAEPLASVAEGEGLHHLSWQQHKGGATAALLVLFGMVILSNLAQKTLGRRADDQVAVTYDQLEAMTSLSRAMVAKGVALLKEIKVISVARQGKGNGKGAIYHQHGIDTPGHYCELPQQHLLEGTKHMRRLRLINEQIKRPSSLHALKLYMVLLTHRANLDNTTRLGYVRIAQYTSMRRAEIALAISVLSSMGLCRLARDDEVPLTRGQKKHNRYIMLGLSAS